MFIKALMHNLPINYRIWRMLGLFRHGRADDPEYAYRICEEYYDFYLSGSIMNQGLDFEVLEFGCGDSVSAGIYFSSRGARATHLIDIKSFATKNIKVYDQFCELLGVYANFKDFEELLVDFSINYFTDGVPSLCNLEDASIDLAYSHSVLQHLTECELDEFIEKLYQKLKPNGVTRHRIDLRNMYDQSSTHHQVPKFLWNLSLFKTLPFYTNRLSIEDYIVKFQSAGLQVLSVNKVENVITSGVYEKETNSRAIAFDVALRKN
jgi:SAM-dependent methyltransferase